MHPFAVHPYVTKALAAAVLLVAVPPAGARSPLQLFMLTRLVSDSAFARKDFAGPP